MSKKKILSALACALVMTITAAIPLYATYADAATVTIDGQQVLFNCDGPIVVDDQVLVPVRDMFEHMGFEVSWDSNLRVATLEGNGMVVIIPAGMYEIIVDGAVINLDVPPQMVNNRLLLPLEAVAEALGWSARWDSVYMVVDIVSPQEEDICMQSDDVYLQEDAYLQQEDIYPELDDSYLYAENVYPEYEDTYNLPEDTDDPDSAPEPEADYDSVGIDVQSILGQDDRFEYFGDWRNLFGELIGRRYGGKIEHAYYFEDGVSLGVQAVDISDLGLDIVSVNVGYITAVFINFGLAGDLTAFNFNGINGVSSYDDVAAMFEIPPYCTGMSILNESIGAVKSYGYWAFDDPGCTRFVRFYFDGNGYVVAISFFVK